MTQQHLWRISEKAQHVGARRKELQEQASAWVAEQLEPDLKELAEHMHVARAEGHTIKEIATAYTGEGSTPNRNAVYAIMGSYPMDNIAGDLPIKWVPREVETATGTRTVYDAQARFDSFGPEKLTGTYTWRFDTPTGTLDPVLTDDDPYPIESAYYRDVLERWVRSHPYPKEG